MMGGMKRDRKLQPGIPPFLLALCLICLPSLVEAGPVEVFVAPDGNDSGPGSIAKPFATLERARDELRRLRSADKNGPTGATVWLRGGDLLRTNVLELGASDGGGSSNPVVWRAYGSEHPRLLGGKKLTGFEKVTDPVLLGRLPESARAHVRVADLSSIGAASFGEMTSRGFGRTRAPAHCELFYDGKPMVLARWPNEGQWVKIAGFPEGDAQPDGHGGKIGKLEEGFFYAGDRPRGWKEPGEVWVHGYWAWDWANSYERIQSLDAERHWIKTDKPYGLYGFRKDQRFYFLNVLEELDEPGEWYLDKDKKKLYFWPPGQLEGKEVLFSTLSEPFVRISGATNLTWAGLKFEASRGNAVEIQGGVSNLIAGCVIRNIGNCGVTISGGFGNGVRSCDLFDTGDGGVTLDGGDRRTLQPAGHFVENCEFARQGRWSKCYVPAVLMSGVGHHVTHNLIYDHPHCAILFTGNDHLIELNEIHHIALETGDVGAIYTGRDYTFRGNRIRHNFIHDTGGVGMGSMGVYMDDCVSGTEIYGNIFYRVQRAAFLGGGRDHHVVNNIFVECNHAVELDGRGLDKSPVWHDMVDKTMRHQLAQIPLPLYRERYPSMKTLDSYYGPPAGPAIEGDAFKGVPPEGNVVARNICVGKWLNVYWHATPEMLELNNNVTNAVSCFLRPFGENPKVGDFSPRADAPIWGLGFQKIPFEQIGLQADPLRKNR
jgi:hypothetical protein